MLLHFFNIALNAAPLQFCSALCLFPLDVVCVQPVSVHLLVCLSVQLPVPSSFISFLDPTLSLSPNLLRLMCA